CFVRFPCVHAAATTPAQRLDVSLRSFHPAVSAFPERVVGSACALSFSRVARRSLTLRPAHSRCHQFVTRFPKASASSLPPWLLRLLPAGAFAGWDLHPLESAALSRRTPATDGKGGSPINSLEWTSSSLTNSAICLSLNPEGSSSSISSVASTSEP